MVADTRVICARRSSRGGDPSDRGLPHPLAGLRGLLPAELQSAQPQPADFSKTLLWALHGEAGRGNEAAEVLAAAGKPALAVSWVWGRSCAAWATRHACSSVG